MGIGFVEEYPVDDDAERLELLFEGKARKDEIGVCSAIPQRCS